MTRHRPQLLLFWLLTLGLSLARAHDLGAMQVVCTFAANGSYSVEVLVDREHLPFRMARMPASDFATVFLQESQFRFDALPQVPQLESLQSGRGPNQFLLRLVGTVPARAKTFAFSTRLDLNEYFLRMKNADDPLTLGFWLNRDLAHPPFDLKQPMRAAGFGAVVHEYVILGFTHIVPKGLDHILFVLGLFLLSTRAKPLLLQVTAFTLAHSITLALSIYGVISLSSRVVEPLIALSIAYVAFENLLVSEYKPWRLLVVFAFGLLHGLGFAGVLTALGLPRSEFAAALVSFNVGVELGQLTVILAALLAVGAWFGKKEWYRRRVVFPASMAIALTGIYWTVERIAA